MPNIFSWWFPVKKYFLVNCDLFWLWLHLCGLCALKIENNNSFSFYIALNLAFWFRKQKQETDLFAEQLQGARDAYLDYSLPFSWPNIYKVYLDSGSPKELIVTHLSQLEGGMDGPDGNKMGCVTTYLDTPGVDWNWEKLSLFSVCLAKIKNKNKKTTQTFLSKGELSAGTGMQIVIQILNVPKYQ